MSYANIITQEIKDSLPNVLVADGTTVTGATLINWAPLGWREIVQTDEPAVGYRVGEYLAVELTQLTCKLAVKTAINLADEAAANAAAQAAELAAKIEYQKSNAKALLDAGQEDIQRALRAFAALTLQEINTLRTKAGLATYTWTQFVNALKAKIDEQT